MATNLGSVEVGHQAFLAEGSEEFGAVRAVNRGDRPTVIVYVENAGDFVISARAIRTVHDGKVIFDRSQLDPDLLHAITHAHDQEE